MRAEKYSIWSPNHLLAVLTPKKLFPNNFSLIELFSTSDLV